MMWCVVSRANYPGSLGTRRAMRDARRAAGRRTMAGSALSSARELQNEGAPDSHRAGGRQRAAHRLRQSASDGKAEACAFLRLVQCATELGERRKYTVELVGWN